MATFNFTSTAGNGITAAISSGGPVSSTGIVIGFRPVPTEPVTGLNPANLEDILGMYHRVHIDEGNVIYSRSDQIRPPFDQVTQVTSYDPEDETASYPCLARQEGERVYLVFQYDDGSGSDVLITRTHDDGETWEDPEIAIPGGTKPVIRVGTDGTILIGALVGDQIHVTRQDPGATSPTAPYTIVDETESPLEVEDDTFDFDQGRSGDAPWLLVAVPAGGTGPVEYQSHDELQSVAEV
jgi:hypothetical protein